MNPDNAMLFLNAPATMISNPPAIYLKKFLKVKIIQ